MTPAPIDQLNLYGLTNNLTELIELFNTNKMPSRIILSGEKGIGKCTLAYHFINYVLSLDEIDNYNLKNFTINNNNRSYKLIKNNFILLDVHENKKTIDISQVRSLIRNLQKSSFNDKARFVLIDNIECLNTNSINALLKILEDTSPNIFFLLINNNKKVLETLLSRCINFKIFLTNEESINISEKILGGNISNFINNDLINYYSTPGKIYNLFIFAQENDLVIDKITLKEFLTILIRENYFKKDSFINEFIFDFTEFYIRKKKLFLKKSYNDFLKKISNTKKFNLDEESLLMEFESKFLNG